MRDAERPAHAAYRFDGFTLDLARGALLASDGVELPLRPKSFAVLRLLVENAGRLLDRDTIMRAVWPDAFVTDDSITQCVGDIRRALDDGARRLLRTVPRRGYLFTAEVSPAGPAAAVPEGPRRLSADRPTSQAMIAPRAERRFALPTSMSPTRRTTAMSDPRYCDVLRIRTGAGAWADGPSRRLTEALGELVIVELSRLGHAVVPADEGAPDEGAQGGRQLEIRVGRQSRRAFTAIARLRDLGTGVVQWAESFTLGEDDFLSPTRGAQARIAAAIGNPVCGRLAEARHTHLRTVPPDELSPAELCVRAAQAVARGDAVSLERARALSERALEVDPDCVPARDILAYRELSLGTLALLEPSAAAERALAHAVAALRLRPTAAMTNCCLGAAAGQLGEPRTAERALAVAMSQAPNDTELLSFVAWEHVMHGRTGQASRLLARATALDPSASLRFPVVHGLLAYAEGRYEDALAVFHHRPAKWQQLIFYYSLAAAGQLGRPDIAERIIRSTDGFAASHAPVLTYRSVGGGSPRDLDHLLEGLRKAGVPDGTVDLTRPSGRKDTPGDATRRSAGWAGTRPPSADATGPAAPLARVERYVGEHLAEPDLTAERVARAVGLSVRQLHRAFEPTGTSFARRVLERQLAAARAELASPAEAGRTVADVAFGWGFDNLVTFYRAFRRAYGCTPGEVRPAAVVDGPT